MRASAERRTWLSRYVIQHEPALRAWLHRRPVIGLEVDDIVQETYARLASVESVDKIQNVRNYMFQTAYSVMVSYIRKSRVVSLRMVDDLSAINVPQDEASPESQAIYRDELRRLLDAVVALPQMVRDVFLLRRLHGLSQRDVAGKLALPESTIEMRMRRANLLISRSLSEDGNSGQDTSMDRDRVSSARSTSDSKTHRQ